MNPVWVDVTFGAGGSTADPTLKICERVVKDFGLDVMMHLTCTNMKLDDLNAVLLRIKEAGVRNILALRGDPPATAETWSACDGGFAHAVDLVRHIRATFGDYFCIGVAGYPEGHSDCESLEKDLEYLKDKVEAGADLIITQLFYDTSAYFDFVKRARDIGITVPIIPGIMPILSFAGLKRMTSMWAVRILESIEAAVEAIQDDEKAVKEFGVDFAANMCTDLIKNGVTGVHIYTMNNEDNVRQIVKRISSVLPEVHNRW